MPKFQPPRGTRDFLPEQAIKRQLVLERIRAVFERFGYDPLQTPAFESWELLSAKGGGGDAIKEEIYYFKDKSARELGLRFDQTVPLARVVASNPQLAKPFKRYELARVWRYDRPGAGRWREFWQADADIVGSASALADAEIIACTAAAFAALNLPVTVRMSSRQVMEGIIAVSGIPQERLADVLRSVDKLDKIGKEGVEKELEGKGVGKKQVEKLLELITIKGKPESALKKIGAVSKEGAAELRAIVQALEPYGTAVELDASLVRGLEYYTGMVFEAAAGGGLSVAGGGRYDKLVKIYGGPPTPAVGVGIGVDRLIDVLEERQLLDAPRTRTKAMVIAVDDAQRAEAVRIAQELRAAGINALTDVKGRNLWKQLDFANGAGIPFAVIVGGKEVRAKRYGLRDLQSGEQKDYAIAEIAKRVKAA